jgi:hypothetical protein
MLPHGLSPEPLRAPDAARHCTMAAALSLTPGWASWEPFMDAPIHYPWGTHALIALVHALSGVAVPGVFTVLLTAGLGALSILAVAALSRQVWNDPRAVVGSAFVYAFLALADGALFSRWGGISSELAFLFALCLGAAMLRGGRLAWSLPLFVLGILLTNQLISLMAGTVFLLVLAGTAYAFPGRRRGCLLAVAGALAGAAFAVPVWLQVLDVDLAGRTVTFSIRQHMELYTLGYTHVGAYLLTMAALSLFAENRPTPLGTLSLLSASVALLLGFTVVFTLYRLWTGLAGEPAAALGPSRWATALTYPLAVYAGAGAAALWQRLGGLRWAVMLSLCLVPLYPMARVARRQIDEDALAAFRYVRERADGNDFAVSMMGNLNAWAGCLTNLESNDVATPPGSDPLTPYAAARRQLPAVVRRNAPLPAWLGDIPSRRFFLVVDTRRHNLAPSPHRTPLARFGRVSVERWNPPHTR